jgi:hypothetical protein
VFGFILILGCVILFVVVVCKNRNGPSAYSSETMASTSDYEYVVPPPPPMIVSGFYTDNDSSPIGIGYQGNAPSDFGYSAAPSGVGYQVSGNDNFSAPSGVGYQVSDATPSDGVGYQI